MQIMMETLFHKKKVLGACVIVLLLILGIASCYNTFDKDINLIPGTINTDDISHQQSLIESEKNMIDSSMTIGGRVGDSAPELMGITNWINSNQITMDQLKGRVVLIDFWTYSCVNCIRTIPYLKEWFERYKDEDLVIIGIHAPEFEFEKLAENVSKFTNLHGIGWPIAQDNNMKTWDAYDNMYWPAKYLIDKDGVIRYRHFGEGNYAQTEIAIQELLSEITPAGQEIPVQLPSDPELDISFRNRMFGKVTREIYSGHNRNFNAVIFGNQPYVIQPEYYENVGKNNYFQEPEVLLSDQLYLNGNWIVRDESIAHGKTVADLNDYLSLKYSAKTVNVVVASESNRPRKIFVTMGGKYLTEENSGLDVVIDGDGHSFVIVKSARLYEVVDNSRYQEDQILRLRMRDEGIHVYAFTFGVYEDGP